MCFYAMAQTVTFTGRDKNNNYVELDRVVITNYTQGWQETVFYPDTTISIQDFSDNDDFTENGRCYLSQNYPNPFAAGTDVNLSVENDGMVTLVIADVSGRARATKTQFLESGTHQFHISVADKGTYLMIAQQNSNIASVKMICSDKGNVERIDYKGSVETENIPPAQTKSRKKHGDLMEYVGYATINGTEMMSQRILQKQEDSQTIALQITEKYESKTISTKSTDDFRVALSLSPFSLNQFEDGYTFTIGDKTASTPEELQSIYRDLGSTEMYVRIATKRHKTAEDITDGEPDENANVHTFDQGIRLCQIAAALDIPINPEIMCAYTYMDMDKQQAPRFDEYPEIYALQNGKEWSQLTLDEICTVLEAYGEFVADSILATGCTVNNWNLGNEANFGFAGISMGLETAVNPKLKKAKKMKRYLAPTFSRGWLKKNVWQYDAEAYAAVKRGILNAYNKLGIDASNVKFSTHIATVVFPPKCSAMFFNYMKEKGYAMETAGISYYPSAPSMSANKKKLLKKTVTKINEKCNLNVFIGEFSYPSGKMDGPFASWNKKVKGYKHDQQGQADIYSDVVSWGKTHGLAGIRYWAPDYEGWYAMSMFEFANKKGTAKNILENHKEIIEK